jgi:hypothetical protein
MSTVITASRRTVILVVGALGAATVATGLAIAASPGACLMSDPIYNAMETHRAAAKAVDDQHAAILAIHPDVPDADHAAMQAALQAEIDAARTMVGVSPTTQEGLQAFADYLREPRQSEVSWYVDQTITVDGHTAIFTSAFGGNEKLIAQRTAELG